MKRDSRVKRLLLRWSGPNSREIYQGLKGVRARPQYTLAEMDYDAYWRARPTFDMQPRFPLIAQFIEPGESVLDIGCGDGAMLAYLKKEKQIRELGIDISEVAIQRATARGVRARAQLLTGPSLDGGEAFDHVVLSEVIEHIPDPENYVRWSWELAQKSLIITFPNIAYWPHRLRLLFGRFPVQWVFHPGEHLRFWSLPDFLDWLRRLGLVEQHSAISIAPSNGVTVGGLHRRLPNLFSNQIVVAIRKPDR